MAQPAKSFQDTLKELWQLLQDYGKQETVGPLKHLGRRIGFGIAGSLLFALGWFLLTLALVRVLQTHSPGGVEWFRVHDWSVYLIAVVFLGIGMYLGAIRKITHPDADLTTPARTAEAATPERNRR